MALDDKQAEEALQVLLDWCAEMLGQSNDVPPTAKRLRNSVTEGSL